ncbi:bile acid:sodium symporter family protein [Salinisphaera sp. SPP-AMP-43]|uniref:bile acid:sodium symporter family protein n=1 Tax=Salinisphaera sp. SPP-AMP-43 TaxID=3121288 RepID=UPI003C6E2CA4
MQRPRFLPDNFILALIAAIAIASVLPIRGMASTFYEHVTTAAIALLFFLHGAKLSREAVVAGASNWRLHLCVLAATFALFPAIGLVAHPLLSSLLTPALAAGVLFVCLLPSTVQSSIAFTSIAGGNVSAAVCSASASNLIGVFLTPALASLFMSQAGHAGGSWSAVAHIVGEIVLPFAAGQFARGWVGGWVAAHPKVVKFVDQGSIVLVVYGAFSASVVEGLWHQLPPSALAWLVAVDLVLLAIVLAVTYGVGRALFVREDALVLLFCGSKKSLASGIPIAQVLFASSALGAIVLPLMIFHQLQLVACAAIARRAAVQSDREQAGTA